MSLALRLLVAFGVVAILATALVGLSMRAQSRDRIETEFAERIDAAAKGVHEVLAHEAEDLGGLLVPLCDHDTIVDRAQLQLERVKGDVGALDDEQRMRIRILVGDQAKANRLDELSLVTGDGTILGSSDLARIGTKDARLAALLARPAKAAPQIRPGGELAMEVHCRRAGGGVTVGLVGARRIASVLAWVGSAFGVRLRAIEPSAKAPASTDEVLVRTLDFPEVEGLRVVASVDRDKSVLAKLDLAILVTGAFALLLAFITAMVLARSLSRPIVALAKATREVVSGEPREVEARGGREIADLAASFNRTIRELTAMRKRLAATERIAARREVARQIAHEIKNPLAPIRAAVETLRRLRAREDPAFDEYFDEATRTVLDEVRRIANIVQEFTAFQRLPPPNLEPTDLAEVARKVVTLHDASADGREGHPSVELVCEPLPMVQADRDQMVQVLTNLVQNGLDAAGAARADPRVVISLGPAPGERVRVVVRDNGPGVSEAMLLRLFEPYATTKENGTGLGLAIVQRIVFEHGGEIAYRAATKGGAVFEITLPVKGPTLLEKPPVETTAKPETKRD